MDLEILYEFEAFAFLSWDFILFLIFVHDLTYDFVLLLDKFELLLLASWNIYIFYIMIVTIL